VKLFQRVLNRKRLLLYMISLMLHTAVMTRLTYINTDSSRRRYNGHWLRIADARLRAHASWLIAFAALWRLPGLAMGEMQQWDEAIYALRVQVVLRFGELWDQSVNMLAGSYYSAHPPLYVWLSTFWTLFLGDAVWTHRLTSALAGAGLVVLTYRMARRVLPLTLATVAGLLVSFAPLLARYSRLGQLDMLLAFFMLATLWAATMYVRDGRRIRFMAGAFFLGAALMTKMLFALSVPAGVLCAGLLLSGEERRRAVLFAFATAAISLPLWLPWLLSFSLRHGEGDLFYLFSSAVPLGATLGGQEGTVKETGMVFYVNQLVVHVSALFPFAIFAMYRTLRARRPSVLVVLMAWLIIQFCALLVTGSSFEVYLLPLLAPLAIFAVHGVQLARKTPVMIRKTLLVCSVLCLVWSLSLDWRVAVKRIAGLASSAGFPSEAFVPLLIFVAVLALAVYVALRCAAKTPAIQLFSSTMLWAVLVVLFAVSVRQYYIVEPSKMDDGAAAVAALVQRTNPGSLALIGNGENPQLSWYLAGADIGWQGDATQIERLEPRTRGIEAVQARLREMAERQRSLVLVELDEVAHGVILSPLDVLPSRYRIVMKTRKYVVAQSGEADSATMQR
jgi:4-amino-4-deoxy-L-arabinose transferase-like glycosyltransferase